MEALMKFYLEVLEATKTKRFKKPGLIQEEYERLEQVHPAPGDPWAQHDAMVSAGLCNQAVRNRLKNRYCNLFPFDSNIVDLPHGDYINASWIRLGSRRYIATMGPMHPESYDDAVYKNDHNAGDDTKNTCPDFWNMCWTTKAKTIVMLCEIARGFTGCSQYFPTSGSVTHGPFTISHKETVVENQDFVDRELELVLGSEKRLIRHLQFKTWPNYGVPEGVTAISKFLKHVHEVGEQRSPEENGPHFVMHCSGGIGRSGTFISSLQAYTVLTSLKTIPGNEYSEIVGPVMAGDDSKAILLETVVNQMRRDRHPWMVEGIRQYVLAYDIVIDLLNSLISSD